MEVLNLRYSCRLDNVNNQHIFVHYRAYRSCRVENTKIYKHEDILVNTYIHIHIYMGGITSLYYYMVVTSRAAFCAALCFMWDSIFVLNSPLESTA